MRYAVADITEAILETMSDFFPGLPFTAMQREQCAREFMYRYKFPFAIAALDCTQIEIKQPAIENYFYYKNYKGEFSLSMQAFVDASFIFRNVSDVEGLQFNLLALTDSFQRWKHA